MYQFTESIREDSQLKPSPFDPKKNVFLMKYLVRFCGYALRNASKPAWFFSCNLISIFDGNCRFLSWPGHY